MKERNSTIDIFKAILLFSAIISNFLHKIGDPNPYINYILYSYHMPLFLAISGYLLSSFTLSLSLKEFTKKYIIRIFIPFCFAWIIFFLFWYYQNISPYTIIRNIIYPMFHLWYVYNFLFSIYFIFILKKLKVTDETILYIGIGISIFIIILITRCIQFSLIITLIQPYYLGFFTFGYYIRQKKLNIKKENISIFGIIIGIVWIIHIFLAPKYNFKKITITFIFLNFLMIIFVLSICFHYPNPTPNKKNKILEWIGKNSYPIYLWHPIIPTFIQYLHLLIIYTWIIAIIGLISLLICIYYLSKITWINKYIFGNNVKD